MSDPARTHPQHADCVSKADWEAARIRAYRQARIFEPSMDGYHAAMATYAAAFGKPDGEVAVLLPDGSTKQPWEFSSSSELTALQQQVAALTQERDEADTRILQLESAIQGVLDAYGDDGWARSDMCRRLRKALETMLPTRKLAAAEAQVAALHQQNEILESQLRELRTMGDAQP